MKLTIKRYPEDMDEYTFYGYMGKFFAEDKYKKELPYIKNNDDRHWILFFNYNNDFIGFCSYEFKKDYVAFTTTYVNIQFRNQKYGKRFCKFLVELFPDDTLKIVSNNKIIIDIFKQHNFIETGKKGSYFIFERKGDDL